MIRIIFSSNCQEGIEEHWIDVGGWYKPVSTFAGNWGARPLADTNGPSFPDGVGKIFTAAKNTAGGARRVEGVLWMMIMGTMQVWILREFQPLLMIL